MAVAPPPAGLVELERTLGSILRAGASSDGWVPPSLVGLTAGEAPDVAALAADTAVREAFSAASLLRGLGAFSAATGITEATGLGRIVAGSDVTPDATDGLDPYPFGTDQWRSWWAGYRPGYDPPSWPPGRPFARSGVAFERGVLTRRVVAAAAVARAVAGVTAIANELGHLGQAMGLLPLAGAVATQGAIHAVRPLTDAAAGAAAAASGSGAPILFTAPATAPAVTHAAVAPLAEAASNADPQLAGFLHALSAVASNVWQEIAGLAAAALTEAQLGRAGAVADAARRPSPRSTGAQAVADARIAGLTRALPVIGASLAPAPGLDALHARVNDLQAQLDANAAEQERARRANPATEAAATFAAGAAAIGAGWLQCRNWKKLGRGGCGMPSNWLDDLLALLTDFLVLENICTVLPWLETAASDIGVPLVEALAAVANAGVCHGAERSTPLHVPALHLPPDEGVTLHLAA